VLDLDSLIDIRILTQLHTLITTANKMKTNSKKIITIIVLCDIRTKNHQVGNDEGSS
jgi:hypothetical protein